jgi:outer membrane protein assembly factor BamB
MTDILARSLSPSPDAATSAVGDETVILHLGNGTYYGLDATGTKVWALLKDGVAPLEICRRLAEEFAVERPIIEADVAVFLTDLLNQDIVIAA